jgi:hypothetical protein
LLGTEGVNHWNAWLIDEDEWVAHVEPVVVELCSEFTSAILVPALELSGGENGGPLTRQQAELWRVWYDPAAAINHPDRGKDALDVWNAGELNGDALRRAKGFNERDDAPTDEERARYIGIRVRDAILAVTGQPGVKAGETIDKSVPPAADSDETGTGETPPGEGGTGNDVTVGPPAEPAGASLDPHDVVRLLGAAETAVWVCRRSAGSRILSKLPNAKKDELRTVPRHQFYAHLGPSYLASLNGNNGKNLADPYDLVRGGTEAFEHMLEEWGYPPERIQILAEMVRHHAAETLDQPAPDALPLALLNV